MAANHTALRVERQGLFEEQLRARHTRSVRRASGLVLVVYPVLLGTGKRFFSDGTPPRELALVSTKAVSSGVIISTYRPNGPLRTGTMGD